MRLDDEQEVTLPQMLESARSFPADVTIPDPDVATTSLLTTTGTSKGAITIPDCCLSLVDGPLVGLSTSDDLTLSLVPTPADAKKPGPLEGPGLPEGSQRLDANGALRGGLVEGISAGARA